MKKLTQSVLLILAVLPSFSLAARRQHRLVLVTPSHDERLPLLQAAAKTWRRGYQSVIVMNHTVRGVERRIPPRKPLLGASGFQDAGDVWWESFDGFPIGKEPPPGSPGKHEMRYVSSIRLANASLGKEYDWLVVGDDDVVFMMDALKDMLSSFDPELPLYISDGLGLNCCSSWVAHNYRDPNCKPGTILACARPGQDAQSTTCADHPSPAAGQACTASMLADVNITCRPLGQTGDAVTPPGVVWAYGNSGCVLSRGLLARITEDHWRNCEVMGPGSNGGGGGDVRIAHCIWAAGYGPTLPMTRAGAAEFDGCVFGAWPSLEGQWAPAMHAIRQSSFKEACDEACRRHLMFDVSTAFEWRSVMERLEEFEHLLLGWWLTYSSARRHLMYEFISTVHVFVHVGGGVVTRCVGQVSELAVHASRTCVPPDAVSVHLLWGDHVKLSSISLDSPAMWGHAQWMSDDTGGVWTTSYSWAEQGEDVLITYK